MEITFGGRDGRGQAVETEGAVTVVFTAGCGRLELRGHDAGAGANEPERNRRPGTTP